MLHLRPIDRTSGVGHFHGLTGGVYKTGTYSPQLARFAITSDSDFVQAAVSAYNPELGLALMRFASPRGFAAHCT